MALKRQNRVGKGFLKKALGQIGRLDSTGLHSVIQRLALEREFLETLFNAIEDGIIVTNNQGIVDYLNASATRLLGISAETVVGQPVSRYLPELDWKTIASADEQGGPAVFHREFEIEYPCPRLLRLHVAPLDGSADGSRGLALIMHDATEARQRTSDAVEAERVHALTLLAGSLAHEIGNPLNALDIHLQLMEREIRRLRRIMGGETTEVLASADRLDGFLKVAKGEVHRLDYIITEFLQALRPTTPKFQSGSINETASETVALLRPEMEARQLTLTEELAERLPSVQFDPAQIKQVLVNLLKNAMQATPPGGFITLSTGANSEAVWLRIHDTGAGIPAERLNRIFEPFFTTKEKGTGLGLLIVQRIIRDHRGQIEVESAVGSGTTFKIWMPLLERRPRMIAPTSSTS
jgi:two-component system, sporulation sensor kinase E